MELLLDMSRKFRLKCGRNMAVCAAEASGPTEVLHWRVTAAAPLPEMTRLSQPAKIKNGFPSRLSFFASFDRHQD